MYSPLAMFAFRGATIPSKWEYTMHQLLAGLWSADTACSEEKGNPVILCLKLDSHRGASWPSRHYLIGRRTSYISGSMTSFILPNHLPSREYFLLSSPFLMIVISALLFLVMLHEDCFSECKAAKLFPQHWQQVRDVKWVQEALGSLVKRLSQMGRIHTQNLVSSSCEVNST